MVALVGKRLGHPNNEEIWRGNDTSCVKTKNWNRFFFSVFAVAILLSVSFAITEKNLQNDTFSSIKIGEYLWENGIRGQYADVFSWVDLPYTYPHWLFDVLTYLVYRIGGFPLVYAACVLLATLIGLLEFFIIFKKTEARAYSLYIACLSLLLISVFITARAQMLTFIAFLLESLFIQHYLYEGRKRSLIMLPILECFISNTHAAVFWFFLILIFPYMAEGIILQIKRKKSRVPENSMSSGRRYIILFLVAAVSLLTGFITPFRFVPFTYLPLTMAGESTEYIFEHLPVVLWESKELVVFLCVLVLLLIKTGAFLRISDGFLVCGLIFMTILSTRHQSLLYILTVPILAEMGWDYCQKQPSFQKQCNSIVRFHPYAICSALMVVLIAFSAMRYADDVFVDESLYPVNAADWILDNLDMEETRIYNGYDYGAYLIFRGIPVMIDSRADLYTPEFNREWDVCGEDGRDVFSDIVDVGTGHSTYQDLFQRYRVTHAVVKNDSFIGRYIALDDTMTQLYHDDCFSIYSVKVSHDMHGGTT